MLHQYCPSELASEPLTASSKRKATYSASSPRAKRHCRSEDSHTTPCHGEPETLIEKLRRAQGKARLVRPIFWTENILQEFQVEFVRTKRPRTSGSGLYDAEESGQARAHATPWDDDDNIRWIKTLGQAGSNIQACLVKEILKRRGMPWITVRNDHAQLRTLRHRSATLGSDELAFLLGNKVATIVVTEGIFGTESSSQACLAYIHFESIALMRKREAWAVMGKRNSDNVEELAKQCRDRERWIRPRQECEDPYIIGILIALAQEQRAKGDIEGQKGWKVHLIGLPETYASEMYFYTATIPRSFLDRIDNPLERGECPGFKVSYELINLTKPRKAARLLYEVLRENALCK
ncbi:hypothetical protein TARUN_8899 [Trichoderma arundinaceum]|uniref:Uncharacterized protein n=1 Tax=Trichoderma arundinaceum TaxID=490622 RepID=A0A395NCA8_TRIAR|nr:hypothetical protein TARUN_8899 [Trichoderma arundinaceum]